MKNPWTQQPIAQQNLKYGACYDVLRTKYQIETEKYEFDYITILNNANQIQELKQKLAVQIINQQFGDMIDPNKFCQRTEQLSQLQGIIENVLKCLEKCSTCVQHNQDTQNFIKNDGSIYINIPFQYKTQFFQILRQALDKQQELIDPDQVIIKQSQNLKELNEQLNFLSEKYTSISNLLEQIKQKE